MYPEPRQKSPAQFFDERTPTPEKPMPDKTPADYYDEHFRPKTPKEDEAPAKEDAPEGENAPGAPVADGPAPVAGPEPETRPAEGGRKGGSKP
jgi:hypothetical protein